MIIKMCGNFRGAFVSGTAGCVATLLHDAVMNPAEGKSNLSFVCFSSEQKLAVEKI